jgi:hypothetical protein
VIPATPLFFFVVTVIRPLHLWLLFYRNAEVTFSQQFSLLLTCWYPSSLTTFKQVIISYIRNGFRCLNLRWSEWPHFTMRINKIVLINKKSNYLKPLYLKKNPGDKQALNWSWRKGSCLSETSELHTVHLKYNCDF